MTTKDATKAVMVTVAAFSIVGTAPWLVVIGVSAGAGLYIGTLFAKDDKKKKDAEDEDDE